MWVKISGQMETVYTRGKTSEGWIFWAYNLQRTQSTGCIMWKRVKTVFVQICSKRFKTNLNWDATTKWTSIQMIFYYWICSSIRKFSKIRIIIVLCFLILAHWREKKGGGLCFLKEHYYLFKFMPEMGLIGLKRTFKPRLESHSVWAGRSQKTQHENKDGIE